MLLLYLGLLKVKYVYAISSTKFVTKKGTWCNTIFINYQNIVENK